VPSRWNAPRLLQEEKCLIRARIVRHLPARRRLTIGCCLTSRPLQISLAILLSWQNPGGFKRAIRLSATLRTSRTRSIPARLARRIKRSSHSSRNNFQPERIYRNRGWRAWPPLRAAFGAARRKKKRGTAGLGKKRALIIRRAGNIPLDTPRSPCIGL